MNELVAMRLMMGVIPAQSRLKPAMRHAAPQRRRGLDLIARGQE